MNMNYTITKILSNNVVVSEKENVIYVLLGKGIGFGRQKGDIISKENSIEQKFVQIDWVEKENYKKLLSEINPQILAVSEELIEFASETLNEELNSHIHVGLADHINFAIKRIDEGIDLVNPFVYEIQLLYPKEYKIAEEGLKLIEEKTGIRLPDSEIGFITLHIYSARVNQNVSDSLKHTRIIKEIIDYIRKLLNIQLEEKSLEYSRLISHLRYSIYRIDAGKNLDNIFLATVKREMNKEFKLAKKICLFISEKLEKEVPEEEIGFIAIHVSRLLEVNRNK